MQDEDRNTMSCTTMMMMLTRMRLGETSKLSNAISRSGVIMAGCKRRFEGQLQHMLARIISSFCKDLSSIYTKAAVYNFCLT